MPEQLVNLKSPVPPTFQILDFGDRAKPLHEVLPGCCRKWIKETDSVYVRLAKQGGLTEAEHSCHKEVLFSSICCIRLIFADMKRVWHWDGEDKENEEKKKMKLISIRELRPTERRSEAVNFSRLISNGYGTPWFQQCVGRERKIQETWENSEQSK
ncbi:PREDICTED: uncharacterized protein C7orf57 homolog, partial [Apaloderma vittatum]|uniref:uncharacterized protein C7orf57 homolog n=1 Tax=Apaloderma vittatum TaxID=57397 RepID=UPI000521A153